MDKVKLFLRKAVHGRLEITGSGRTFAKLPLWLAILTAVSSVKFAVVCVVLVIAAGMRAEITEQ